LGIEGGTESCSEGRAEDIGTDTAAGDQSLVYGPNEPLSRIHLLQVTCVQAEDAAPDISPRQTGLVFISNNDKPSDKV
jgi:hypothetical protein